ncbi:hypothetical protein BDB01DRAFT_853240 [Pilobolus umbonatus]|nr:hypothetical protein BDB01DRAFT_853240 [Pilobolus umbonatus]
MLADISVICSIEGQVRHKRRLTKQLFFIDIQPVDGSDRSQIFFRSDDNSQSDESVQEAFRLCKLGSIVRVEVGNTLDPKEQFNKDYPVWQSNKPVEVIEPYTAPNVFIQDRALGSMKKNRTEETLRLWDGTKKEKSKLYCKYWVNQSTCKRRELCLFMHPTGDEFIKAREEWVAERLKNRLMITHDPDDPHTSKKPHALRALIFADWIKKTFAELTTEVVLDIAGGKGELAMFLSHGFGIPSVVIEPNERKRPSYWYTRLRRLMIRFQTEDCHQPDWENNDILIEKDEWPYPTSPLYMNTLLDDQFIKEHHELISNAGLLVGLHSDQATVPIVEIAIRLNKPFAVVPCCVFSHENRDRLLKSGKLVSCTEDLVQYICEKDTTGRGVIQTDYLDFEVLSIMDSYHEYVS